MVDHVADNDEHALTIVRDIVPPYDAYCIDLAQAHGSLDAFHAQGWAYQHVLAGHGRPLVDDARSKVLRALEKKPRPIPGGARPHAD